MKSVIAIVTLFTIVFPSYCFCMERQTKGSSAAKASDDQADKIQISQSEFDNKLADAQRTVRNGTIVTAIGVPVFAGGLVMMVYGLKGMIESGSTSNKNIALTMGGTAATVAGTVVSAMGIVGITGGLVQKSEVRRKYVVAPVVSENSYGVSFGMVF